MKIGFPGAMGMDICTFGALLYGGINNRVIIPRRRLPDLIRL